METIAEKLLKEVTAEQETPAIVATPDIVQVKVQTVTKPRYFSLAWQARQFERARFGWMAMLLTIQSCIGAVACLFISHDPAAVVPLAIGAAVTMGSNALFIALASAKICLIGFYTSVIVNCAFIIMGLI